MQSLLKSGEKQCHIQPLKASQTGKGILLVHRWRQIWLWQAGSHFCSTAQGLSSTTGWRRSSHGHAAKQVLHTKQPEWQNPQFQTDRELFGVARLLKVSPLDMISRVMLWQLIVTGFQAAMMRARITAHHGSLQGCGL